eukprot:XP_008764319.1 PREDICTED: proline-rich receptor-like protein kinase PERK10 [Rattus norvegicus]
MIQEAPEGPTPQKEISSISSPRASRKQEQKLTSLAPPPPRAPSRPPTSNHRPPTLPRPGHPLEPAPYIASLPRTPPPAAINLPHEPSPLPADPPASAPQPHSSSRHVTPLTPPPHSSLSPTPRHARTPRAPATRRRPHPTTSHPPSRPHPGAAPLLLPSPAPRTSPLVTCHLFLLLAQPGFPSLSPACPPRSALSLLRLARPPLRLLPRLSSTEISTYSPHRISHCTQQYKLVHGPEHSVFSSADFSEDQPHCNGKAHLAAPTGPVFSRELPLSFDVFQV